MFATDANSQSDIGNQQAQSLCDGTRERNGSFSRSSYKTELSLV